MVGWLVGWFAGAWMPSSDHTLGTELYQSTPPPPNTHPHTHTHPTNSLPTLWLNECVLVYMDPVASADQLLRWIAREQPEACVATYEQIRPHDPFGKMMLANLEVRALLATGGGGRGPVLSLALAVGRAKNLD